MKWAILFRVLAKKTVESKKDAELQCLFLLFTAARIGKKS
jgi:hypothetical protein